MPLLIIPDIFGRTPALERLAGRLAAGLPESPEIIDPYGDGRWFRRETEAYNHFTTRLGIPAYSCLIAAALKKYEAPVGLLGFSAGASSIWHLSGSGSHPAVSRAVGFYGAQIRHDTGIRPAFDVHLIFPRAEPHFDVDELISALAPRVTWEKTTGEHGFMNEYSRGFDPALYRDFTANRLPDLFARKGNRRDRPGKDSPG